MVFTPVQLASTTRTCSDNTMLRPSAKAGRPSTQSSREEAQAVREARGAVGRKRLISTWAGSRAPIRARVARPEERQARPPSRASPSREARRQQVQQGVVEARHAAEHQQAPEQQQQAGQHSGEGQLIEGRG